MPNLPPGVHTVKWAPVLSPRRHTGIGSNGLKRAGDAWATSPVLKFQPKRSTMLLGTDDTVLASQCPPMSHTLRRCQLRVDEAKSMHKQGNGSYRF